MIVTDLVDQLERLANLWIAGALTDEEYATQKSRAIRGQKREQQEEEVVPSPPPAKEILTMVSRRFAVPLSGAAIAGIVGAAIFLWPSHDMSPTPITGGGSSSQPGVSALTNVISNGCIESIRYEADLLCNLEMDDARRRSNGLVMTYDFERVLKDFRGSKDYCPEYASIGRSLAAEAFSAVGTRLNTESPMQAPALCRNEVQRRVDDALGRVSLAEEADVRARLEALEGRRLGEFQEYVSSLANTSSFHSDLRIDGPMSSSALERFHEALIGSSGGDGQIIKMRDGTFLVFHFFDGGDQGDGSGTIIVDIDKKVTLGLALLHDKLAMTRRNNRIEAFATNWCFSVMNDSLRPSFCRQFHSRNNKNEYPDLIEYSDR